MITKTLRTPADLSAFNVEARKVIIGHRDHGGKLYEAVIRQATSQRSDAQKRLQWLWNKAMSDHMGLDINYVHGMMKRRHLVPLLAEHDPEEFAFWMRIEEQFGADEEMINRVAFKCLETKHLDLRVFSQLLNSIEKENNHMGLPHPDDLYNIAMGRTREKPKMQGMR